MTQIKIYVDEDAMDNDVVAALRSRNVTVLATSEAGLTRNTDEEQLVFATERGYALYSFNMGDFIRLHTEWIGAGREHAGVILAPQQRFSVGEQLRRIIRIRTSVTAASMRNRVEFLGNWG